MPDAVDTRRPMTRAQFAEAASFAHDGWWLTGEDSFIHVPSVMEVEGWNLYGHPGNLRLTESQRVLMMWSDLVGQTSNGGFAQFIENLSGSLKLAHALILKLEWPELTERFDRAFREQAGDPLDPRAPLTGIFEPEAWRTGRQALLRRLARQGLSWWQPVTPARLAEVERGFEDWRLQVIYSDAMAAGEMPSLPKIPEPPTEAAEAFDDWFYRDETKAESRTFIGAFIERRRDDLCRLTD